MDQSVKPKLDQGEMISVKIGRGVKQDAVCRQFYSTCTANILIRKFRYFKIGGHVIRSVKYVDGLVLLVKEEAVLQA